VLQFKAKFQQGGVLGWGQSCHRQSQNLLLK